MKRLRVLLAISLLAAIPFARDASASSSLANPGFESGTAGWTTVGTTSISSDAHSGTSAASITGSGKFTSDAIDPGPPGAYRAVSAYVKIPGEGTSGDTANFTIRFYDGAGAELGEKYQTGSITANCSSTYYRWAGPWCYQYGIAVVPDGAETARWVFETGAGATDTWLLDDAVFAPVTSLPEATGSRLDVPATEATVHIDASHVIAPITDLSAGDGQLYTGSALPGNEDDATLTSTIRNHSAPGVLRFPGGDYAAGYDWEHPQSGAGGNPYSDIDGFMRYARASGVKEILYTANMSGRVPGFTVQYTGSAAAATLKVDGSSLRVDLDGAADLTVDFAVDDTVGKVVSRIARTTGFTSAISAPYRVNDPVFEELVAIDAADAKSSQTVQVDVGNVHKILRFEDYANNAASTVIGPGGLTRDAALAAKGLPAGPYNIRYLELGNELWQGPAMTPLDPPQAAQKTADIARALHAQNPAVKVGTWFVSPAADQAGCCGSGGAQFVFNHVFARIAGPHVDFIADHPYENFHLTYGGMLAFPQHLKRINLVKLDQETFAAHSPDGRTKVPVFISEYNLVTAQTFVPSGAVSPNYQLVNGLVTADEIGVLLTDGAASTTIHDQTDYPFGTHVMTVGDGVEVQPSGYALEMWNRHMGESLVRTVSASPTYDMGQADFVRYAMPPGGSGKRYPLQRAYASTDSNRLYVMLINVSGVDPLATGSADAALATRITLSGFDPEATGSVYTFTGAAGLGAFNALNTAGPSSIVPGQFGITQTPLTGASSDFTYTTAPHSITVIELTRKPALPGQCGIAELKKCDKKSKK